MPGRRLVFRPLALKARQSFVNIWHEAALDILCELDKIVQSHPEYGTQTSRKGRFSLKLKVSAHQSLLLCEIIYSFTDRAVSWETFTWQTVKTPPQKQKTP